MVSPVSQRSKMAQIVGINCVETSAIKQSWLKHTFRILSQLVQIRFAPSHLFTFKLDVEVDGVVASR